MSALNYIDIDGSRLEGGGQILRIALACSCLLGSSHPGISIHSIRAARSTPGLAAQHLSGVKLVARIANGQLSQCAIGSTSLQFKSGDRRCCETFYEEDIQTAGSLTLLIQIALPCLVFKNLLVENFKAESSTVQLNLIGGTNVSTSPPIDHFIHILCPLLSIMKIRIQPSLKRRGYYPIGKGNVSLEIHQVTTIDPIQLLVAGELIELGGIIYGNIQ